MDKMLVADLIENIEPYLTPDEFLVALATKAAEWEREACVEICRQQSRLQLNEGVMRGIDACVDAIEARGEK